MNYTDTFINANGIELPMFRKQGNSLYQYMDNAYIHVYQNPHCHSLKTLVHAYNNDTADEN